ncbi:MAG: hypothetical protein K6F91_08475, partial [Ruminococcus sp.]|nr:hypothetical protein [Ruminococcus sp.]
MRKSFKRACAAAAALMMAGTTAMSAYAIIPKWGYWHYLSDEETAKADNSPATAELKVNKPYLNVTVNCNDFSYEDLDFVIKCDGETVGKFNRNTYSRFSFDNGNSNSDTVKNQKVYNITGADNDKSAFFSVGFSIPNSDLSDVIDFSELTDLTILVLEGFRATAISGEFPNEEYDYYLAPNGTGYIGTFDTEKYEIVDTKTVPAGQYIVDVSEDYIDFMKNGASDSTVSIETTQSDWDDPSYTRDSFRFSEVPGTSLRSVPTGDYRIMFHGGNIFNRDLVVTDYDREFVKIRVPVTDFPKIENVNGKYCIKGVYNDDSDFYYPVADFDIDPETGNRRYVLFPFYSGGAITADILTTEGGKAYYDIWVEKDCPEIKYQTSYAPNGGGQVNQYADITAHVDRVVASMDYPEDGVTLYNVPAGEYTVELAGENADDYNIYNNTLTVTDTKELQSINVTFEKKPEPVYSLGLTAKSNAEECYVGDIFEVTATLTNNGDTDLTNLSVAFEDTEIGTAETLKVGESVDFTIKLKANEEDIASGGVINLSATAKELDEPATATINVKVSALPEE